LERSENDWNNVEQTERQVYIPFMPTCGPCSHRNRDEIDLQLINGVSFRRIAAAFNLSLGSISRHKAHVKEMIRARTQEQREEHGGVLLSRVEELISETREILTSAKTDKNLTAATSAVNAITRLLELLGRLDGSLQSANAGGIHLRMSKTINVNVHSYDNDVEFALLVKEATRSFDPATIEHLKQLAESAITQP
jgi:hypothetical protein